MGKSALGRGKGNRGHATGTELGSRDTMVTERQVPQDSVGYTYQDNRNSRSIDYEGSSFYFVGVITSLHLRNSVIV